jgi:hypothetical protein
MSIALLIPHTINHAVKILAALLSPMKTLKFPPLSICSLGIS